MKKTQISRYEYDALGGGKSYEKIHNIPKQNAECLHMPRWQGG